MIRPISINVQVVFSILTVISIIRALVSFLIFSALIINIKPINGVVKAFHKLSVQKQKC